jgi:predicted ATP-dependent endonuclease of OLD family
LLASIRLHTDALDEFIEFAGTWLSELELERPVQRQGETALELDLFYREGPTPKELAWCGDGVQVFLQLLLHLFNLRDSNTIVLDEPDVYLHADLQRRLIRLLEGSESQIIMSTHSPEIVVEAPPDAVVWVDRSRPRGVLAPEPSLLAGLSGAMGTQFNLRLARVLRARLALFVEGDDIDYLVNLAKTIGASGLVTEEGLAVVPLGGVSNWQRLEGFSWLAESLLQEAVSGFVILDRDYHSNEAVKSVSNQLKKASLEPHIWRRKELESYLTLAGDFAAFESSPETGGAHSCEGV